MTFVILSAGVPLTDLYNVHSGSFVTLRSGFGGSAKTSVLKLSIPPKIRNCFRNSLREAIIDLIPCVHNSPYLDFPLLRSFPYHHGGSYGLYVPCLLSPQRTGEN